MNLLCQRLAMAVWLTGASVAAGAVPLQGDMAVTVDESGGHGIDGQFSLEPAKNWRLRASAGQAVGSEQTGELHGKLFGLGATFRGESAGVSLDYDWFGDDSNYRAATLAARAWLQAGDFEFALLARRRDLEIELVLDLPLRTLRRRLEISGHGAGAQISFTRGEFTAYVLGLAYDYDAAFEDFMDLLGSPNLASRPRIEALVGSFITQAQGAIDRQYGIGLQRSFGRNSVALDLTSVHDAVRDASSLGMALTWTRAHSAHVDWNLSAGVMDSIDFGDIAFLGLGVGLAN